MGLDGHLNFLDPNNPSKPRSVVKGHNKFITALAVDKQRNSVYAGAYDSIITAWDITTGANQKLEGKGHTNQINQLVVAGDNLISAAKDDSVRFTSATQRTFGADRLGLDGDATSVSSNASGSLVATVSASSIYLVRDKKLGSPTAVSYGAKAIALAPNDSEVVVGGADNNLYVYPVSGSSLGAPKKLDSVHRGAITCVAYSPCGKYFAVGDSNREVVIWDAASKTTKVTGLVFHTARVNGVVWSLDSTHVVSGSLDQNLIVWNIAEPTKRIIVKNSHHGGVNAVAWIDNNTVASAGQDCAWKTHSFKY